ESLAERAKLGTLEPAPGLSGKVIAALADHGAAGTSDATLSGVPTDAAGEPLPGPWILRDQALVLQEATAELLEGIADDPAASGAYVRGCELLRGVTVVATVDELESAAHALVERAEAGGWIRSDDGPLVPEPEPGLERLSATVSLIAPTGIPAHVVLATPQQRNRAESQAAGPISWLPLSLSADHANVPYELRERVLAGLDPELIPADLVTVADLRGELHAHSDWSDGRATIIEMARGARERGDEYFLVTDHSAPYAMVGGLDDARLLAQAEEIAAANATLAAETRDEGAPAFRVLHGSEVEILADGRLGLADATLERLDWVVASIHVSQKQPADKLLERMRLVMENPLVDAIGHPTSRRLLRRHRTALDVSALIDLAVEHDVVLEVNSNPDRLDLDSEQAALALSRGVRLTINTDAHRVATLDYRHHGVAVARRAGARVGDVVNCLPVEQLLAGRRRANR
ncbi:MAG: polymerase, partial [Thermoleophilia bacterium]|nr:polymerase [Thermoleophilia bacterium]